MGDRDFEITSTKHIGGEKSGYTSYVCGEYQIDFRKATPTRKARCDVMSPEGDPDDELLSALVLALVEDQARG